MRTSMTNLCTSRDLGVLSHSSTIMATDVHSVMNAKSSSNTLKPLTNPHTIRGIATLKDVERFSKRHLERYRETIVKLPIVKYLSNKLPILSKAIYILLKI